MLNKKPLKVAAIVVITAFLLVGSAIAADVTGLYNWMAGGPGYVGQFTNTGAGGALKAIASSDTKSALTVKNMGDGGGLTSLLGPSASGDAIYALGKTSTSTGVRGWNDSIGYGVVGGSTDGIGGYFQGGDNQDPDILLGASSASQDDGTIFSAPWYDGSDIMLHSNDEVYVFVDQDGLGDDGSFRVFNSDAYLMLGAEEDGDVLVGNDVYLATEDPGAVGAIYSFEDPSASMMLRVNDDVFIDVDVNQDSDQGCVIIRQPVGDYLWFVCEQTGMTVSGPSAMAVETGSGPRAMYAMGSPDLRFEDFGSGTLVDGRATVTIDANFLETVNTTEPYHVFLTPLGDCNGLYVTNRTTTSFEVRELGGGTASIEFDYRIVADRLGYEDLRMEAIDMESDEWPEGAPHEPHSLGEDAPVRGESTTHEIAPPKAVGE